MGFRCGIVGLPNVGKSTLFNALTETAAAQAANYPFCTIEPNVGRVAVPDELLAKIREVDAIIHVLRCFEGGDVTHVEGRIDPIADAETVETELMLADLDSLEKRVTGFAKKAAQGDKEARSAASVLGQALDLLRAGKPARLTQPRDED